MFAIFTTASRGESSAPKRRGLLNRLSEAVDAYAAYRMQMAVPEFELRRAARAVTRYRQQMRRAA